MRTRSVHSREQVPESVNRVVRSRGRPLDPATKTYLESRLGHWLGNVRIHTDAKAAASARAIDAAAYTVGEHIVFGEGRYHPDSLHGLRLLAHEATHVAQQPRGTTPAAAPTRIAAAGQASEAEAHQAAGAVVRGGDAHPVARADPRTVHRHKDDLVACGGGQSGAMFVIAAGKLVHVATSVSGHVGSGEHEKGAGPIPAAWYTLHPGVNNKPVTALQGGACGANAIAQGYQEITSEEKVPCEAGSAH